MSYFTSNKHESSWIQLGRRNVAGLPIVTAWFCMNNMSTLFSFVYREIYLYCSDEGLSDRRSGGL